MDRYWLELAPKERVNRAYLPEFRDRWRAHFIPPRAKSLPPNAIDLTLYYNGCLKQCIFATPNDSEATEYTWGNLPYGAVQLDGIPFDIRGVVHVTGKTVEVRTPNLLPKAVTNIVIGQKCQRIHFIHGTQWRDPIGTPVGRYRISFADGTHETVVLEFGLDILSWWVGFNQVQGDLFRARRIAKGTNGLLQTDLWSLGLYMRTWQNPRPDVAIRSIDFESAMGESAPFLAGLTVE